MLLVALVCVSGAALSPVAGTPPFLGAPAARAAAKPGPVDRAVAALQAAQRSDGGFGVQPGATSSDPATSVWAALALEAVGVHPADQPGRGTTVLSYLERRGAALADTGDLARLALVLRAADADGDLLPGTTAKLVARQRADGGWADGATGPARVAASSFAILALSTAADDASRAALTRGAAWLKAASDGTGWGAAAGAAARPDQTGLALQALHVAEPDEFELTSAAQSFLNTEGRADGGLAGARASESDAVVTAFAMQGLRATGFDPATFSGLSGVTAGAYLTGRQRTNGSFGTTLRTAQVLAGFNGVAFPLREVARGSARASSAAPADPRKNGAAGGATEGGAAALSGGRAGGDPSSSPGGAPSSSSSGPGSASSGATSGSSSSAPAGASGSASGGSASAPSPDVSAAVAAAKPTASGVASSSRKTATTPAEASGSSSDVDGLVVGATRAAATTPAISTGAGAGGSDSTDPALVLAGAMVLLALAGAALERRRPRRVLS